MEASSAGNSHADETFKRPAVPSSATRKVAERSTPSRSRRLSQSTSGKVSQDAEGLETVKPATRTLSSSSLAENPRRTTPRKTAMVGGGGGGSARIPPSRDLNSSRASREPAHPPLNRSSNGLSSNTKTPLRSSVSTSRGVSATLSTSQARRTLAVSETGVRGGQIAGAATIRRKPGPLLSAIPVPSTSSQGSRTLHRPPSVVTTANTLSASSSTTEQADQSRRVDAPRRSSAELVVAAAAVQQTSRKSSWETVRSTRDSLASTLRRRSSIALLVGDDADRSWETVESRRASRTAAGLASSTMETPRRPSQPNPAPIVSPPSPNSAEASSGVPRVCATDDAASPETLSTMSHFSHAAFLSPMPPPPIDVLSDPPPRPRPAAHVNRSKPRESTSLDEILRLGMLNQSQLAGTTAGGSGGGLELELLLDEGSSRIMTEELRDWLGPPTEDAGSPAPAPTTPWRGRIVSVSASAKRRSLATSGQALGSVSKDQRATLSPPPSRNGQAGQVLLLRQSTTEASDLRRQVAALSAELELVKRERDKTATTVERGQQAVKDERVEALHRELEAAQARENELRSDWEAERRAMEEDMAELAAATAAATTSSLALAAVPQPSDEAAAAAVHSQEARETERAHWNLLLAASESAGASLRAGTIFGQVEQLAKREREDTRLALASLQTLARGLEGWRALL